MANIDDKLKQKEDQNYRIPDEMIREAEEFQRENKLKSEGSKVSSSELKTKVWDLDEMARDKYAENKIKNPTARAIFKLYMTLTNQGLEEIQKKVERIFEGQILAQKNDLSLINGEIRSKDSEIAGLYSGMEDLAGRIKRNETGIVVTKTQDKDIESIITAKSEGRDPKELELKAVGEEYLEKDVTSLNKQRREYDLIIRNANTDLRMQYTDVRVKSKEYVAAENDRKVLLGCHSEASNNLCDLYDQKVEMSSGLVRIIKQRIVSIGLAERSEEAVRLNHELTAGLKDYMQKNFNFFLSRQELGLESPKDDYRDRVIEEGVNRFCEKGEIDNESARTKAHETLNRMGINV